eukprot:6036360-Pleurochrysis_carterae.AAC.1
MQRQDSLRYPKTIGARHLSSGRSQEWKKFVPQQWPCCTGKHGVSTGLGVCYERAQEAEVLHACRKATEWAKVSRLGEMWAHDARYPLCDA